MTQTYNRREPRAGHPRRRRIFAAKASVALAAGTVGLGAIAASAAPSDPVVDPATGWAYTKESIDTGQGFGFQLALDEVNRKVYLSDMKALRSTIDPATGEITTAPGAPNANQGQPSGQVVVVDSATREVVANHDFNGLSRIDGSGPNTAPPDASYFGSVGQQPNQYSSMRTDWGAYGVEVDPYTVYGGVADPTIITTTARQRANDVPVYDDNGNIVPGETASYGGGLVVYRASQGGPTDADTIHLFEDDGVPVLQGPRRIAVNTTTHKAYVTSLGTQRGNGPQPGFITEVDLLTKAVTARIALPDEVSGETTIEPGTVGVAVDVENNLIYAGAMAGTGLYVIDGDAINRSNPKSVVLNAGTVTKLGAVLDGNQRPTYSPSDKRLYISQYDAKKVSVVDADPQSATYGDELHEITGVDTNSTFVDGNRGLLFSADLKDFNVKVYDTTTFEQVLTLPTSGQALNMAMDPVTGDLWVSNWGGNGWSESWTPKVDVFSLTEVTTHMKPDAATYYVPTTWTEGQPLVITGTGWLTTPKGATPPYPEDYVQSGSAIAVKIRIAGATGWIMPTTVLTVPDGLNEPGGLDEVWAIVEAANDGTFTATIPYPSAAMTGTPAPVGAQIELAFLTGSVKTFDTPRGAPGGEPPLGNPVVTVVAPGTAPTVPDVPDDPDDPTPPEPGEVTVTFDVEAAAGGLSLTVAGTSVDLGAAALTPELDKLTASGTLPNVTVADTRATDLGWTVAGTVSGFSTAPGAQLGWTPQVISTTTGQTVTAGDAVDPSVGIAGGATLASALSGQGKGTAVANAGLVLEAPTNTPAGTHSGTITLTLS